MFRHSISDLLDSIRKEYDIIIQENITLKQHIKDLEEKCSYHLKEINKARMCVRELQSVINRGVQLKLLKMGADWKIEGTPICNIYLKDSINSFNTVSNISITRNNNLILGIINNKRAYVLLDGWYTFFNHEIVKSAAIARESSDTHILFSSDGRNAFVASKDNMIKKFALKEKIMLSKIDIGEYQTVQHVNNKIIVSDNFNIKIYDEKLTLINKYYGIAEEKLTFIYSTPIFSFGITVDKKLLCFNYETGDIKECSIYNKNIVALDINDKYMLLGSTDGNIQLYSIEDNLDLKLIAEYNYGSTLYSVKFISDEYFISSGRDCSFRMWNIRNKKMIRCLAHKDSVYKIDVIDNYVCTVGADGRIRLWEIKIK